MYLKIKIGVLSIFNALTVTGFKVLRINDGYRNIMEKVESMVIEPRINIAEQWIEQKLDHFDANDSRTWQMKYYEQLQYWKSNSPIYLFINGEYPATPSFLNTGMLYELAQETNGAMYLTEHRYYGESQPLNRSQFNVDDLKYLSAPQALADIATLLRTIKDKIPYNNSKVVVVGGSYAGNLAAWMKLTYPDLVDAAIASSGPVLAKRDFYEYLKVVGNDYRKYGTANCLDNIKNMFHRFDTLFQTKHGIKQLIKEEIICENTDMTKIENKEIFFLAKLSDFQDNAQYGTTTVIRNHCSKLNNANKHSILLDNNNKYFWNNKMSCYDYNFNKMAQEYYEDENNSLLCWTYQTCNEFGYFQTTVLDDQLFTNNVPVEFYDKFCTSLFGVDFNKDRVIESVKKTNDMYEGKSINVSEVIFVNGELDPWSSLGILDGISDAPAFYIPRASHCSDLYSNEPDDDEELKEARIRIKNQIKKWIEVDDS